MNINEHKRSYINGKLDSKYAENCNEEVHDLYHNFNMLHSTKYRLKIKSLKNYGNK